MTSISEKILENIKEKHLSPAPRWKFLARNLILWTLFAAALIVGALSFAVIADGLINHDWDIYLRLHKTFWQYALLSLPYFWIVFLLLFSWIAYYDFVHIKGWYHHRVYLVILASIVVSLLLGLALFYTGVGKKIDQVLDANISFYKIKSMNKRNVWCHPKDGLLGGEIVAMSMDDKGGRFVIRDCNGQDWDVKQPVRKSFLMKIGDKIKIIGKEMEKQRFEAEEFRQW
jgi:hypothetical protein